MKRLGLGHPRPKGWTVNALNSFNLQSVKGKNSNWFVFFKMLDLKRMPRACTTVILARTAETFKQEKMQWIIHLVHLSISFSKARHSLKYSILFKQSNSVVLVGFFLRSPAWRMLFSAGLGEECGISGD